MHAVPGEPLYRWAQSAREVVVTLPLPAGVRSRAISCTFKTSGLRAALKGAAEPLLHVEVPHSSALPRPTSPHPPVSPSPPVSLRPRSSRRVA